MHIPKLNEEFKIHALKWKQDCCCIIY